MTEKSLRVVFMGTPDFAVGALNKILESRHQVVAVYSQPPRPKGRGQAVQESPVHARAKEAGIPVFTPVNFKKDEDIAQFLSHEADVAVVAAYGLILPRVILEGPVQGCLNIHASLLPRWRGAAPIQRAILEGDEETGITIMQMDEGLDTGPMIKKKAVPIRPETTATSLHDILSLLGATMIVEVLDRIAETGYIESQPQPVHGFTYAKMLKKEDGKIDFSESAAVLDRQIRALNPWPGTWCDSTRGRLKILEANAGEESSDRPAGEILPDGLSVACGGGTVLHVRVVQPENKKPLSAVDARNGGYLKAGDKLI